MLDGLPSFSSWPNLEYLTNLAEITPDDMYPNTLPYVVFCEGYLSDTDCDNILMDSLGMESYKFGENSCGAETQEYDRPLSNELKPIVDFLNYVNRKVWNYDIATSYAWMQNYNKQSSYALHMDGNFGQTRKLTALALVSAPNLYSGGNVVFTIPQHTFTLPKTRGTIAVFPQWLLHEVTEITDGFRHTINMGAYGPPFR